MCSKFQYVGAYFYIFICESYVNCLIIINNNLFSCNTFSSFIFYFSYVYEIHVL